MAGKCNLTAPRDQHRAACDAHVVHGRQSSPLRALNLRKSHRRAAKAHSSRRHGGGGMGAGRAVCARGGAPRAGMRHREEGGLEV